MTAEAAIKCLLYLVLLALGSILNGTIIWLVRKHRSLQTVTHLWVVSLCWSQLLTSVLTIPFAVIASAADNWLLGGIFCQICGYYSFVFRTVSIVSIAGIAVDRYHVISRPFSKRMRKKTAKVLIIFTWWSSFVICCPPLMGIGLFRYSPYHHMCQVSWRIGGPGLIYTVFYVMTVYISTVLTTLCSYRLIYKVTQTQATKHKKPNENQTKHSKPTSKQLPTTNKNSETLKNSSDAISKRKRLSDFVSSRYALLISRLHSTSTSHPNIDKKANQIIIMVLMVFLFAWTPYVGHALHSAISGGPRINFSAGVGWAEFFVTWLSLSTCIWDPLLYAALTRNFKTHLRDLFRRWRFPFKVFSGSSDIGKTSSSQSNTKMDAVDQRQSGEIFKRHISHIASATEMSFNALDDYYFGENLPVVGSLAEEVLYTLSQSSMMSNQRRRLSFKPRHQSSMTSIENKSFALDEAGKTLQTIAEVHPQAKRPPATTRFIPFSSERNEKAKQLSHSSGKWKTFLNSSVHDTRRPRTSVENKSHRSSKTTDEKLQTNKSKEPTAKFLMINTPSRNLSPTKEVSLTPLEELEKTSKRRKTLPMSCNLPNNVDSAVVSARNEMKSWNVKYEGSPFYRKKDNKS